MFVLRKEKEKMNNTMAYNQIKREKRWRVNRKRKYPWKQTTKSRFKKG